MTEKEKDLLNALTKKMGELYVSFRKRYVMSIPNGSMFVPKDRNAVACVLTDHVLFNHLRQRYAVAVFAGPCTSKFICFDVHDGAAETVHAIIDCLIALGFPQYSDRSRCTFQL